MCECFILCIFEVDLDFLVDVIGKNFDFYKVWDIMFKNEKFGGYGECLVVIGMIDMVIWDVVVKIEGKLLF